MESDQQPAPNPERVRGSAESAQPQHEQADCHPRLLSDEPAEVDEFGTGAHSRIAEAICDLVDEEPQGKAVAIVGTWGSGKSTVVRLIERRWMDSSTRRVFSFDAWAHQGDSLQRSFVEELAGKLSGDWVETKTADEVIAEITGRTDKVWSSTSPVLSWWGKIEALLIFLVPAGLVLLSGWLSARSRNAEAPLDLWLRLAVGAIFAPLFVAILLGAWVLVRSKEKNKTVPLTDEPNRVDLLGLLVHLSRNVTRTITTRTPDPTSIEFRAAFEKLLGSALNDSDRRLVVVMDNLDRIDADQAVAIWSTMRTFTDPGPRKAATPWRDRLWLLVPFDKHALSRLWPEAPETEDGAASKATEGQADESEQIYPFPATEALPLSEAFERKSFQVGFTLPRLLLSDWRAYFEEQLKRALPEHEAVEDFFTAYRVFRACRSGSDFEATPREIKSFVNALSAQHRVWGHQIPLSVQCLYVILDRDRRLSVESIRSGKIVPSSVVQLLGEGIEQWQEMLAALYFNAPLGGAIQILKSDDVERALTQASGEQLAALAEQKWFATVCQDVVDRVSRAWPPTTAANAACAMGDAGLDGEEWSEVWGNLRRAVLQPDDWKVLEPNTGRGLALIITKSAAPEAIAVAERLLLTFSAAVPVKPDDLDV